MKPLFSSFLLGVSGFAGFAMAQSLPQLGPGFSSLYTLTPLGTVNAVPIPFSSIVFQQSNPNVLLLGGPSANAAAQLYTIPLTRDPNTHHVTALGAPTFLANSPNADGGLIYAPNGDLLFTEYSNNQIGELKPGSTNPDKTINVPLPPSTGALQIVPFGFPGAGNLVIDTISDSNFCATALTPDSQGTYSIGSCSANAQTSGGAEAILYVPQGLPGFSGPTMLVVYYFANVVTAYSVDQHGLPIVSSGQTFLTGAVQSAQAGGLQGAAIDPITGDLFFSTFDKNVSNQIYEVSLTSPGPAPTVTSVVNIADFSTRLCPGALAAVFGTHFGSNATDVSVLVGGRSAALLTSSVTPTQFTIEIPFELSAGTFNVIVTVNGVPSAVFPITLSSACPALFTQNQLGSGFALLSRSDGSAVKLSAPGKPGDQLTAYAVGLGPTSPPTPSGDPPAVAQTATTPVLNIADQTAALSFAGLTPGTLGIYTVKFTVPNGAQGTAPMVLSTGTQSSQSGVTIPLAGISSVVNNASFAHPGTIAPGTIASLFVNGLGSASASEISGIFPNSESEGVQVNFNTTGGPMFHLLPTVSPQQIDLFVPSELPTSGTVNVQLTTSAGTSPTYTLNMVPSSPGFYRITDPKSSTQYVIAQFANTTWLALPSSTTTKLGLPACTSKTAILTQCGQPASVGDYLVLYLTGLGLATPNGDPKGAALPTGQNPPADGSVLYETPVKPTVTIGGVPVVPIYSGLAPGYAGEYQIDLQVPPGVAPGDNVTLTVTLNGASDTTNISIQPGSAHPGQ